MNSRKCLFVLLTVALMSVCALAAQQIEGTVKDETGAMIPGVTVVLTNTDTGVSRDTLSDDTGRYIFTNIRTGTYEVKAELEGFQPVRISGIRVSVGDSLSYPLVMVVGGMATEVEIIAEVEQVETTTSQLDNVIDEKRIMDLPLNGRNPLNLVFLTPGVANYRGFASANGGRGRGNNYQLDGVDNNDTAVIGNVVDVNVDAVAEFRVITSNPSAEYGRAGSAIIDVVSKGGTNEFHGNVFWFHRNDNLDAATWAENYYDTGKGEFKRNQYGASFGGPIIPDKLFFFFNTEFLKIRTAGTFTAVTPTQAFRDQITNSAIANIFNSYYPLPNAGNPSVFDETGAVAWNGQYAWAEPNKSDRYQYTIKVDYALNENHSLFGRYFTNVSDVPAVGNLPGTSIGVYQFEGKSWAYALDWTWLVSPTLVNNVKIGGNLTDFAWDREEPTGPGDLSFNGGWNTAYPLATNYGFYAYGDQGRRTGTINLKDTVTWTKGNHNVKFGVDLRWIHDNGDSNFQLWPAFHFDSYFNGSPYGNMGRNVMAGWVDSFFQSVYGDGLQYYPGFGDLRGWRQQEYDFFIQDDWKITPNLMLNLGLRYELKPTPYEINGLLSNVLNDELVSQGYRLPNINNFFDPDNWDTGNWLTGNPLWVGTGADIFLEDDSQRIYDAHKTNFAPRFGFSYDPWGDGKTAIRAGYGISFDRLCDNLLSWNSAQMPFGFTGISSSQPAGFNGIYPNGMAYYFNGVTAPPPTLHPTPETWASQIIYNSELDQAYMQTWNFSIQRELWPGNIFTLAYAGSSGTHLLIRNNPNQMPLPSTELIQGLIDNGYVTGYGEPYIPAVVRYYSLQNTQWLTLHYVNSDGHSRYDSMQMSFSRRFQDGLQAQVNYTWAKAFDNGSDSIYTDGGNAPFQSNWYNRDYDKGYAAFDVRHNLSASFIYELPIGPGKMIAGDTDGILGNILGGWQINGIVQANSGYPLDYKVPIDTLGTGYTNDRGPSRPDVVNTNVTTDGNLVGPTQSNFVWNAATQRADYPLGYQGGYYKGFFRQPGYWNVDFSLFKEIRFPWFTAEGSKLQLRFEAFNLFNHTNWNQPNRNFASATMGQTFGAAANRQVQIGAKFIF